MTDYVPSESHFNQVSGKEIGQYIALMPNGHVEVLNFEQPRNFTPIDLLHTKEAFQKAAVAETYSEEPEFKLYFGREGAKIKKIFVYKDSAKNITDFNQMSGYISDHLKQNPDSYELVHEILIQLLENPSLKIDGAYYSDSKQVDYTRFFNFLSSNLLKADKNVLRALSLFIKDPDYKHYQ